MDSQTVIISIVSGVAFIGMYLGAIAWWDIHRLSKRVRSLEVIIAAQLMDEQTQ